MKIDRQIYFDSVRKSLFGNMSQRQVDGQNAILDAWEESPLSRDQRLLSYPLATTYHETSKEMWPIEEYGKGKGRLYGRPDPETKQTYYGRGLVQLTHRENYARATSELELTGENDLEWHADRALDLTIATNIMFLGMEEGWFRSDKNGKPYTLDRFFGMQADDAFNAREIINGDKNIVPTWSNGVSIGNLVKDYHEKFLAALEAATASHPVPKPEPTPEMQVITITIAVPPGVSIAIKTENQQ